MFKNIFKNQSSYFHLLIWLFIFFVVCLYFTDKYEIFRKKECLPEVYGSKEANLVLKYYHSDWCRECIEEEKILHEIIAEKKVFKLEKYYYDNCREETIKHQVLGVPYFIFEREGRAIFRYPAFADKDKLEELICKYTRC